MTWQLQEAKNKLSQVVETTLSDGPQIISRHGKNTVVVISYDEYKKMTNKKSVKQALMAMDISNLDLRRDTLTEGRATSLDYVNLLNHEAHHLPA